MSVSSKFKNDAEKINLLEHIQQGNYSAEVGSFDGRSKIHMFIRSSFHRFSQFGIKHVFFFHVQVVFRDSQINILIFLSLTDQFGGSEFHMFIFFHQQFGFEEFNQLILMQK